jgi:hypothetical protein
MLHGKYLKPNGVVIQSIIRNNIIVSEHKSEKLHRAVVFFDQKFHWFVSLNQAKEFAKDKPKACIFSIIDDYVIAMNKCEAV